MKYTVKHNMGFISNLIFISMALYLYAVAQKGNSTIGFRFASPTFYPMRSNETQMNSFMFNILINNAVSLAVSMFCCDAFTEYSKYSYLYYLT